jgi:CRP-like cAMP-binding protein
MKNENFEIIEDLIKKHELVNYLDNESLKNLKIKVFNKGEFICQEDEILDRFYFHLDGKSKVYKLKPNGKALLLRFYKDFVVIGDVEYKQISRASSYIEAMSKVVTLYLDMKFIHNNLLNSSKFLNLICDSLSRKLLGLSYQSAQNQLFELKNRLAAYIEMTHDNYFITENLVDISELLGSNYRHTLRIIGKFKDQGIIKKTKEGFHIEDLPKLKDIGNKLY